LSALEAAVAKAPNSETAYYFLARAQRNRDDFEAALRSFTRTIELNPSYTDAYAQVGLTLLFLRRPAEALDNIRYGMRLSPKDPALPFWLRFAAEAEIELGNYSEAIRDLERSVEMAPKQLRAWGVLTAAHALAGNAVASQKHLSKVKELGSGFSDEQLLKRIGRSSRLGPNRVHDGFRMALSMPSSKGARGEP
jgi:tetratricopeptide (TPR) repeat protein